MNWIPVKNRLPKKGYYLCYLGSKEWNAWEPQEMILAYFKKNWITPNSQHDLTEHVTHWKNRPTPPKK